jgi:hypothetical protein
MANLARSTKLHLQYKISMPSVSCSDIGIEKTGYEQLHRQSLFFRINLFKKLFHQLHKFILQVLPLDYFHVKNLFLLETEYLKLLFSFFYPTSQCVQIEI